MGALVDENVNVTSPTSGPVTATLTPDNVPGLMADTEYSVSVRVCTEFSPGRCDYRDSGIATVGKSPNWQNSCVCACVLGCLSAATGMCATLHASM